MRPLKRLSQFDAFGSILYMLFSWPSSQLSDFIELKHVIKRHDNAYFEYDGFIIIVGSSNELNLERITRYCMKYVDSVASGGPYLSN